MPNLSSWSMPWSTLVDRLTYYDPRHYDWSIILGQDHANLLAEKLAAVKEPPETVTADSLREYIFDAYQVDESDKLPELQLRVYCGRSSTPARMRHLDALENVIRNVTGHSLLAEYVIKYFAEQEATLNVNARIFESAVLRNGGLIHLARIDAVAGKPTAYEIGDTLVEITVVPELYGHYPAVRIVLRPVSGDGGELRLTANIYKSQTIQVSGYDGSFASSMEMLRNVNAGWKAFVDTNLKRLLEAKAKIR